MSKSCWSGLPFHMLRMENMTDCGAAWRCAAPSRPRCKTQNHFLPSEARRSHCAAFTAKAGETWPHVTLDTSHHAYSHFTTLFKLQIGSFSNCSFKTLYMQKVALHAYTSSSHLVNEGTNSAVLEISTFCYLIILRKEWHRWANCRLTSLKDNMSRDDEAGHCQRFNSLSTYGHVLCGLKKTVSQNSKIKKKIKKIDDTDALKWYVAYWMFHTTA